MDAGTLDKSIVQMCVVYLSKIALKEAHKRRYSTAAGRQSGRRRTWGQINMSSQLADRLRLSHSSVLCRLPGFQNLDEAGVSAVVERMDVEIWEDAVICKQGMPADKMYVVMSGRVGIEIVGDDPDAMPQLVRRWGSWRSLAKMRSYLQARCAGRPCVPSQELW